MSQYDFGNLSSPLPGATLVNTHLEPWRDAIHSMHKGGSRPSYAVAGMGWIDDTTGVWELKIFNGTDDIIAGYIDSVTLEFQAAGTLLYTAQTVGGTANDIELDDLKPFNFQLEDGALIFSLPPTPNTTAVTCSVAGTTAKAVKKILPSGYADMEAFDIGGIPSILYYSADNDFFISFFTFYEGFGSERSGNFTAGFGNYKYREVATADIECELPAASGLTSYYFFDYYADGGDITFTPDAGDSINGGAAGVSFVARKGSTGRVFKTQANDWWVSGNLPLLSHGQCQLVKDGTDLRLNPLGGNKLIINGYNEEVPSAGVALAPTSLAADTTYYIYAYMNAGTMTLEASTTAYATDSTTGVTIKSGDATRTLVGMARTDASTAWADSAAQRFVRSYFNDLGIVASGAFSVQRSTTSTTPAEINTEIRTEFLLWEGESNCVTFAGSNNKDTTSGSTNTYAYVDGTTAVVGTRTQAFTAGAWSNCSFSGGMGSALATEGYHYMTIFGQNNSAGTSTWFVAAGSIGELSVITAGGRA